MDNKNGFTLVEVMVAMVVLTIGLLALWPLHYTATNSNAQSYIDTTAIFDGSSQIEQWMQKKFKSSSLTDEDGDGTDQDINGTGWDSSGNFFGLNDYPGCTAAVSRGVLPGCTDEAADGSDSFETPSGIVTLYYNVADDYPTPYSKTVRVLLLRNHGTLPIIFDFTKERGI